MCDPMNKFVKIYCLASYIDLALHYLDLLDLRSTEFVALTGAGFVIHMIVYFILINLY